MIFIIMEEKGFIFTFDFADYKSTKDFVNSIKHMSDDKFLKQIYLMAYGSKDSYVEPYKTPKTNYEWGPESVKITLLWAFSV